MWLPVMNTSNKAMKLEPYTYKVYDKFKKEYVERMVEAASMFDINKTIMRCLVMNTSNKAMKLEPYTYKVYDKFKKEYVERMVEAASMFDINKTIMRCLVKNLAMFGLGLYIYAGEDIPEKMADDNNVNTQQEPIPVQPKRTRKSRPIQQPVQEKYAGIRIALQQCKTQDSLMELYKQHQNEVTGNTEIKALFTERKLQLNQAV